MITVLPFTVLYCFAFPLPSLAPDACLPLASAAVLDGKRKTWLPKKSSDATSSVYGALETRSQAVRRTSVVGTSRIYDAPPTTSGQVSPEIFGQA